MQGKRRIQQLLAAAGARPNKRLGQNFLIDLNLIRLLVKAAQVSPDDVVLEVGCGTGSLTQELAAKAAHVIAVEYDRTLARIAREQLAGADNVRILQCDALENKNTLDRRVVHALQVAGQHSPGRTMLVANLPYNVASPLMINLVAGPIAIDAMYVTVQKEVALRMTAGPGKSDYGPLSIALAAAGSSRILRTLKPSVFWPSPQVDSAFVEFITESGARAQIKDFKLLMDVVGLFMGHRRKTIRACTKLAEDKLAQIDHWPAICAQCDIDPASRPEQIPPQQYVKLANRCRDVLSDKPNSDPI